MPARFFTHLPLLVACWLLAAVAHAQQTFPIAAPSDERPGLFAFTNATLYTDYKTRVEGATLLIRDGKVVAAGQGVSIPKGTVVQDCAGRNIYPALIDLYATGYGLPVVAQAPTGGGFGRPQQALSAKKGPYGWNEAIRSEYNAAENFSNDSKAADEWRKIGFATLLTHRADGISRGTGALITLNDQREQESILVSSASHHLSFTKGSSPQTYPSSLMGCIALLRQTYLDGQWYKSNGYAEERNLSLEAWNQIQPLPQIIEAGDKLDILRAAQLAKEFGVKYIVKTAGDEYQRIDDVKATGMTLIVPLNYPEGYDVRDPYEAMQVSLKELKHWEMAPANTGRLQAAGINICLTTHGLKEKSKFWEALRKAIEYGLPEEAALKALTYNPAQTLGLYNSVGSLEPGKIASFIITQGELFRPDMKIIQTWAAGENYDINPDKYMGKDLRGTYQLAVGTTAYTLLVKGKPAAPEAQVMKADSAKVKATLTYSNELLSLSFQPDTLAKGVFTLSGTSSGSNWTGHGTQPDGTWIAWSATQTKPADPDRPGKQAALTTPAVGDMLYPFIAFGKNERPKTETVLIQNATVWTNEKDGIMLNTDVLISGGKIQKIGRRLPVQDNATVVDGTGKHLTAGIIDEHSHIAVSRSVNEFGQESSAEVRIGDVIDSEDSDIYRQLAGGVTSSHILHGSANPIGGQTQLIKLRWGASPEEMKFANWPGFIKFALGENVKQSNSSNSTRYPQTRMGVEQVYMDYFTRAQEYSRLKKSGKPYRKDLEMEALAEILDSKRHITCHSYVQSEITMMMRVAEYFGFKVNTFTHILEGYKVADKMARHGAGGSTFADWWAYKMEVYEAIPYNARLMADRGVTVAINSDDAEMARRLNQEAAKTIQFGNMKEEDAWKLVTLNPAKLLHIDDRVGSLRPGKDADIVLWNVSPLSVYARAEKTWVDGVRYFDRDADVQAQQQVRIERARLIQKVLAEKKGGEGGERPRGPKGHYHCDSDHDEGK